MILDGKRLSESQRLKLLADEEHAALESMAYEHHSDDPRPAHLLATLLSIPAPVDKAMGETNAREEVAQTNANPSPTHGLLRDREAAALLIVALAC